MHTHEQHRWQHMRHWIMPCSSCYRFYNSWCLSNFFGLRFRLLFFRPLVDPVIFKQCPRNLPCLTIPTYSTTFPHPQGFQSTAHLFAYLSGGVGDSGWLPKGAWCSYWKKVKVDCLYASRQMVIDWTPLGGFSGVPNSSGLLCLSTEKNWSQSLRSDGWDVIH